MHGHGVQKRQLLLQRRSLEVTLPLVQRFPHGVHQGVRQATWLATHTLQLQLQQLQRGEATTQCKMLVPWSQGCQRHTADLILLLCGRHRIGLQFAHKSSATWVLCNGSLHSDRALMPAAVLAHVEWQAVAE